MKDRLPGGLADEKSISDFDRKELLKGIKIELEHTDDKDLALEIAMDHLTEHPDYYSALKTMEEELENQCDNPMRQNHDYGGNFLDKVEERLKKRTSRLVTLNKFASAPKFKENQKVWVTEGNYRSFSGFISQVFEVDNNSDYYDGENYYRVKIEYNGRPTILEEPESHLSLSDNFLYQSEGWQELNRKKEESEAPVAEPEYSDLKYGEYNVVMGDKGHYIFQGVSEDLSRYKTNDPNLRLILAINEGSSYKIAEDLNRNYDVGGSIDKLILDVAVNALYILAPHRITHSRFVKDYYPEYILPALTKELQRPDGLTSLNPKIIKEYYPEIRQYFIPIVANLEYRAFASYFLKERYNDVGRYHWMIQKDFLNNDPELKEALKTNFLKVQDNVFMKNNMHEIYPEVMLDRFKGSHNLQREPGFIIQFKDSFPELMEFLPATLSKSPEKAFKLESDYDKGFQGKFTEYLKNLSPEERSSLLSNVVKAERPGNIYHSIEFGMKDKKTGEDVRQYVNEIPTEVWDTLIERELENISGIRYFFTINAHKNIPFSEEAIDSMYQAYITQVMEGSTPDSEILTDSGFEKLMQKNGIPRDFLIKIVHNMHEEGKDTLVSNMISNLFAEFAEKISLENNEPTTQQLAMVSRYMIGGYFKKSDDHTLNKMLQIDKVWRDKQPHRDKRYHHATVNNLSYALNERESISEATFVRFFDIVDEASYRDHGTQFPLNPSSKTLSKIEGLSEETTRRYAEYTANNFHKQFFLYGPKGVVTDSNLPDTAEQLIDHFNIRENYEEMDEQKKQETIEGFNKFLEKNRNKEKEKTFHMLYPDLIPVALSKFSFSDYKFDQSIQMMDEFIEFLNIEMVRHIIFKKIEDDVSYHSYGFYKWKKVEDTAKVFRKLIAIDPEGYNGLLLSISKKSSSVFLDSDLYLDAGEVGRQAVINALNSVTVRYESDLGFESHFFDYVILPENIEVLNILHQKYISAEPDDDDYYDGPDPIPARVIKAFNDAGFPAAISHLRKVKDLNVAKQIYNNSSHDIELKREVPPEIKINTSIYQNEQRPHGFKDETRYTISNNNVDPTDVLYSIGKQLIHAGDGIAHTNVGASGFTNSWSLSSFRKIKETEESEGSDGLVIEQYQSDYPPVLFHLFSGKGHSRYGTGDEALQRLIREYGDESAINSYIQESEASLEHERKVKEKRKLKIEDLDFSVRAHRVLERGGFKRLGHLANCSKNELLRTRIFGRKTINEVEEVLHEHGLALQETDLMVGDRVTVERKGHAFYKHSGEIIHVSLVSEDGDYEPEPYQVLFDEEVNYESKEWIGRRDLEPKASNSEDISLPIELAPAVKDARTHFEYISKGYSYLAIINAIRVAQAQDIEHVYILKKAAYYANIGNDAKAKKLYEDIPSAIGQVILDHDSGEELWKIPATEETIEALRAMLQEATGKDRDYDFSRTPAQNNIIRQERDRERKKKRQDWTPNPEKIEQLQSIQSLISEKLNQLGAEIDIPNFYTPQQALRFLNQEIKGKAVNKKQFNREFGRINRDLGMLSRASRRRQRMIKISILNRKFNRR